MADDTETSLDTMSEIRSLEGFDSLVSACKRYNASWTVFGKRGRYTRSLESSLLRQVDDFVAWHGSHGTTVAERDVMWTIGWDSAG